MSGWADVGLQLWVAVCFLAKILYIGLKPRLHAWHSHRQSRSQSFSSVSDQWEMRRRFTFFIFRNSTQLPTPAKKIAKCRSCSAMLWKWMVCLLFCGWSGLLGLCMVQTSQTDDFWNWCHLTLRWRISLSLVLLESSWLQPPKDVLRLLITCRAFV